MQDPPSHHLFKIIYKINAFALPISASGIINMLSSFIAMMMIAQLGEVQLAAAALAVPTFITIMTITATMFFAVGILISHHKGKENHPYEIGLVVKNGFWLACFLWIPSALILWHIDKLLLVLGQEPKLVALTHNYFHFTALGMLPLMIVCVLTQFYLGVGNSRFSLIISIISLPITVITSYGFILGHFGLPKLGLAGGACAYLITQSVLLVVVVFIMYLRKSVHQYGIFNKPFMPKYSICKSIFDLGMPVGIQFGTEIAAFTFSTYLLGYFGVVALASSQIVNQYFMLVLMVTLGLAQALTLFISQAYAKHDAKLINQYLYASLLTLIVYALVATLFFILFPAALIKFFIGKNTIDPALLHLTKIFFEISCVVMFIDGARHLLSGALRGFHDSQAPMRIGIIAMWLVSLPCCYLVGFTLNGGPIGLRIGFVTGFIFASLMLWLRIRKKLFHME